MAHLDSRLQRGLQKILTSPFAVIDGGGFYETGNGNISQVPAFDVKYSSPSPSSIQPLVDWGIVTIPQQV